jgi:hypothetical protein
MGTYFAVESEFFQDLLTFRGEGFRQPVEFFDAQARQGFESPFMFTNCPVFHACKNKPQKSASIHKMFNS